MSSIYGTETEYTYLEENYPDYPSDNFEYWNKDDNKDSTCALEEKKSDRITSYEKKGDNTIMDALEKDTNISLFGRLIKENPEIAKVLKTDNLTLFAPSNTYFNELNLKAMKELKREYGVPYSKLKVREIIMSYMVKMVLYPEQLKDRTYRIDTYSKTNTIIVKNMKILNQNHLLAPESDAVKLGNKIEYAIQCKNGFVYVVSRPIFPLVLFGVNSINV